MIPQVLREQVARQQGPQRRVRRKIVGQQYRWKGGLGFKIVQQVAVDAGRPNAAICIPIQYGCAIRMQFGTECLKISRLQSTREVEVAKKGLRVGPESIRGGKRGSWQRICS